MNATTPMQNEGMAPELAFTELILRFLYCIYDIASHSHVFVFDLPHLYRFVKSK
jgi:hypothetical protein